MTTRAVRVKTIPFKQLVKKVEPDIDNKIVIEYRFSNGRIFKRHEGRGN